MQAAIDTAAPAWAPQRLRGVRLSAPPRAGALTWGLGGCLPLPLLGGGPTIDLLLDPQGLRSGRSGPVQWWRSGDWAFGKLDLPDGAEGLAEAAQQAYGALFQALHDSGCPHPLRLWNYLPRINADGGGLERYRQFNIGRQQAFLDAGRPAFEGAPAACAVGRPDGGLSLRFLAGTRAPRPLENPRQVPAWRYSARFGPRSPTFSRAALVPMTAGRLAMWVSGTASIVGEASCHAGDLKAQVIETVSNLQALLAAAHSAALAPGLRRETSNPPARPFELQDLSYTMYLRHTGDAAAARTHFAHALGTEPDCVQLQADICRAELLVEIEAHGVAIGALA
jgi:chorismate lyase/3-hydroxybenzoate synthase